MNVIHIVTPHFSLSRLRVSITKIYNANIQRFPACADALTMALNSFFLSPQGERMKVRGDMKQLARNLRQNQTNAEQRLWGHLRNRQLEDHKFKRQYWIENYIVDFICIEKRLAVELDGSQHADEPVAENDQQRSAFLEAHGIKVLRFWNNEVFDNLEGVLENILAALQIHPSPYPLPSRGEGKKTASFGPRLPRKNESGQGNESSRTSYSNLSP